jgi:ABC-type transport system involved in multi-copper enzyme maturation permease subunit
LGVVCFIVLLLSVHGSTDLLLYFTVLGIARFGTLIGGLAALGLGSSSLGEDWDRGSMEFLLTRPRSRGYFIWTAWAVGMAELFVLAATSVSVATTALYFQTGYAPSFWLLTMGAPLFAILALAYGITLFFSALARSGRRGLTVGLGIAVACFVISTWKDTHLKAAVSRSFFSVEFRGAFVHPVVQASIPVGRLLGWLGAALVFLLAAEIVFNRAEV